MIKSRDLVWSQTSPTIDIISQTSTSRVVFAPADYIQFTERTKGLEANVHLMELMQL
jgi:hypothetical protein